MSRCILTRSIEPHVLVCVKHIHVGSRFFIFYHMLCFLLGGRPCLLIRLQRDFGASTVYPSTRLTPTETMTSDHDTLLDHLDIHDCSEQERYPPLDNQRASPPKAENDVPPHFHPASYCLVHNERCRYTKDTAGSGESRVAHLSNIPPTSSCICCTTHSGGSVKPGCGPRAARERSKGVRCRRHSFHPGRGPSQGLRPLFSQEGRRHGSLGPWPWTKNQWSPATRSVDSRQVSALSARPHSCPGTASTAVARLPRARTSRPAREQQRRHRRSRARETTIVPLGLQPWSTSFPRYSSNRTWKARRGS